MKSQTRNIVIGSIIVIAVALIIWKSGIIKTGDDNFIQARFYDENGNEIPTTPTISVVQGIPGVKYIDLTVNLLSTGEQSIFCDLLSLQPAQFDTAMPKQTKLLLKGQKISWTSNLLDVTPLESANPVVFSVTAKCKYQLGAETINLPEKTGTISLTIKANPTANFDINVGTKLPTEYCGDAICQSTETLTSCPDDCIVSTQIYDCNQESANVATACGGLSTGGYTLRGPGSWSSFYTASNTYDTNWDTFGQPTSGGVEVEIIYKKASKFISAEWIVKDNTGTTNLIIPASCWNYLSTELKLNVASQAGGTGEVVWRCPNSATTYVDLRKSANTLVYEESIKWKVDPTIV